MTNDEAKFMLRGYRPNGRDASDPAFAEALAQADRDPGLRAWFEREQQFDRVVAAALGDIAPPPALRDSIHAGTRLDTRRARPAPFPAWIGLAAGFALLLGAIALLSDRLPGGRGGATYAALLDVAWTDLRGEHPDVAHVSAFGEVGEWLENPDTRLLAGIPFDFQGLVDRGCRTQKIAGSVFVEICFQREGTLFHVYLAPRGDFRDEDLDGEPLFQQKGRIASALWADERFVYVLASEDGLDGLRAIL